MSASSRKGQDNAVRRSLTINVIEAKGLSVKSADKPSIYCVLSVNNVHYNTSHSDRGNKPEWKQKFTFAESAIQPKDAQLRVILFNKVGSKDTAIGEADVNLNDLTPNQTWKEWHTLGDDKNKAKVLLEINLVTDVPPTQKRKNRMNESLTRRISWGAKQTSTAAVVSPAKKHIEESTTTDDEVHVAKASGTGATSSGVEANGKRRRVFDFVGSGTDAEMYEDQFKQTYQDETDMEDAFATDDTKSHIGGDDSDANTPATTAADRMPSSIPDDSTEHGLGAPVDPDAPPPMLSEVLAASLSTSELPLGPEPPVAKKSSSLVISKREDSNKSDKSEKSETSEKPSPVIATPSKTKSKKPKKSKSKPVKTMNPVAEEGEEDEDDSSSTQVASAVPKSAKETPTRKKSVAGGLRGFFKRLGGTPKATKSGSIPEETTSAEAPESPASDTQLVLPVIKEASSSAANDTPRTPRSARMKVDIFEAMKAELKSYIELEKAFIQDIQLLISVYLQPAKEATVPIEHISVLLLPVENMVQAHSNVLKLVEKRVKDDHIAIGTMMDDFLAQVSDSYKLYRSKQVFLLSLLDSSPTEKSMADHAAILNWVEETLETSSSLKPTKSVPPLQELILEPMHRLARLSFTLEQLVEVTPQTHPDHPNIRKAAARIQLLQAEVSMRGTTYRSMNKLAEIDSMLEFPSGSPPFLLADETAKRSYLLEGPIMLLDQHLDHCQFNKIFVFLFSDMLLFCKQLARDPASRTPSSVKPKRTSSSTKPTTPRQNSVARNSTTVSTNKFIVVSKLMLDRIFLVDPEDKKGEMATYSRAKASKNKKSDVEVINPSGQEENRGEEQDEVEELSDLDCLLEIVDMGVSIHRLRFKNKDDKKLWLATLNSALSNIKLSFNVNERQYLYKLLLNHNLKPIFGAFSNSDKMASWPTAPFVAALASRQLIERLHSNTFATVNLHKNSAGVVEASAPDSEVTLIKQEVVQLKREHQRQVDELKSQLEMTKEETSSLLQQLREKDELLAAAPSKGRRSRSSTMENVSSSSIDATKKKKKSTANDDKAEEYLAKYLDLMSSVNAREKRENELLKRLEVAEATMSKRAEEFGKALATVSTLLEKNQAELDESRKDRKNMAQQNDKLSGLVEQLLLTMKSGSGGNGSVATSSSSFVTAVPSTPVRASPAPAKSESSGTASVAASPSDKVTRANSANKPPVPTKPSAVKPQASTPAVLASSPSWRGSQGSASGASTGSQSPAQEKPASAIPSFGTRGKRPSSISLIAAAPLDAPPPPLVVDGVAVANSADSSESSGPPPTIPGSPGPNGPLSRVGVSSPGPGLFGSTGKTPSRLDLGVAPANGSGPVSPGGRGKERKVKNVRYPAKEEDKSGSWISKKLGFNSKSKKEDGSASPQPWRQPRSGGNSSDAPVTVKKTNKVDWSQTRAETYFSDDLGSDYDPAMALSPSDFERQQQEEFAARGNDGSDYSDNDN